MRLLKPREKPRERCRWDTAAAYTRMVFAWSVLLRCAANSIHNSVLGPRKRFMSIGLAEGDVPPGPCHVGAWRLMDSRPW